MGNYMYDVLDFQGLPFLSPFVFVDPINMCN